MYSTNKELRCQQRQNVPYIPTHPCERSPYPLYSDKYQSNIKLVYCFFLITLVNSEQALRMRTTWSEFTKHF